MLLTNKHNLPAPIVNAVRADPYDRGPADYSVSDLIDSPRHKTLMWRHDAKVEEDVAGRVFSLFGRATHQILEWGAEEHQKAEERLFIEVEVNGVKVMVSGAMDLQERITPSRVKIKDWKVTTVWTYKAEKPGWPNQLNCYAHMVRNAQWSGEYDWKQKKWVLHEREPMEVGGLEIGAILRDWGASKAKRDPAYPQAPIQMLELPLWPAEQAEKYFLDRVARHIDARSRDFAGAELPKCTPEERWMDSPEFAVIKEGGKRALAIYENEQEAITHVNNLNVPAFIEQRGGTPKRCEDWCKVAAWCNQYQRELENVS